MAPEIAAASVRAPDQRDRQPRAQPIDGSRPIVGTLSFGRVDLLTGGAEEVLATNVRTGGFTLSDDGYVLLYVGGAPYDRIAVGYVGSLGLFQTRVDVTPGDPEARRRLAARPDRRAQPVRRRADGQPARHLLHPLLMRAALLALLIAGCGSSPTSTAPPWLPDAHVSVGGLGVTNHDCRTGICRHNENTDLIAWHGAIWLVHRTAESQILGPNSSLHVYRSTTAARLRRDARDHPGADRSRHPRSALLRRRRQAPHQGADAAAGDRRCATPTSTPSRSARRRTDGVDLDARSPRSARTLELLAHQAEHGGVLLHGGVRGRRQDGRAVPSTDGAQRGPRGADVYGVAADTPLETELDASCRRASCSRWCAWTAPTTSCSATRAGCAPRSAGPTPPYDAFTCPPELDGQRLDGPLTFFWHDRLFVGRAQAPRRRRAQAHRALRDHRHARRRPARRSRSGASCRRRATPRTPARRRCPTGALAGDLVLGRPRRPTRPGCSACSTRPTSGRRRSIRSKLQ